MALLDFLPVVGPALDAASSIVSANAQRNAFKSRYQDTVADMRKAGLNPALAYGQGGGNPSTVPLANVGDSLVKGVTGAAQATQARATAAKTAAETGLLLAQTKALTEKPFLENDLLRADISYRGEQGQATRAQRFLTKAQEGLAYQHTEESKGRTQLITAQQALTEAQTGVAHNEAYYKGVLGDLSAMEYSRLSQTFDSDVRAQIARNAADLFKPENAQATNAGIQLDNVIRGLSMAQLRAMAAYYSGAGKYQPYADALSRYAEQLLPWKRNRDENRGPQVPTRPWGYNE